MFSTETISAENSAQEHSFFVKLSRFSSVTNKVKKRWILAVQAFQSNQDWSRRQTLLSLQKWITRKHSVIIQLLTDCQSRISLHVSHFKKGQRSCTVAEQQPCSCLAWGHPNRKEKGFWSDTVEACCFFALPQLTLWGFAELSLPRSYSPQFYTEVITFVRLSYRILTSFLNAAPSFHSVILQGLFFSSWEGHLRGKTRVDWILAGLRV